MTASRPPGRKIFRAAGRKASNTSSSRLTAILRAWNTRVQGWILERGSRKTGIEQLGKFGRRGDLFLAPGGNDRAHGLPPPFLLPVISEEAPETSLFPRIDDLPRRQRLFRIHPHIQGAFPHETKPFFRLIELHRRDAKVNENPVGFLNLAGQRGKISMDEGHFGAEKGKASSRRFLAPRDPDRFR